MNSKQSNTSSKFITYLFRFMLIFDINRFKILSSSNNTIKVQIGWADDGSAYYDEDEETQEIEWDIQTFENMEDALSLAEYLIDNKLLISDKISISKEVLKEKIGWDSCKYDDAIDTLLSIRVDMIDDGKRTDYFFVHF